MGDLGIFFLKEQIIHSVRDFFHSLGFHEVITPVLNPALPLEPNLYAFKTSWHANKGAREFYLPCSPEMQLKKMLARGIGNCFSLSKSFRDLEDSGPQHRPEFLMLEWYREGADYRKIMEDTKDLILHINNVILASPAKSGTRPESKKDPGVIPLRGIPQDDAAINWTEYSLADLFHKYAGLDLEKIMDDKNMVTEAKKIGYRVEGANWEQLFNQIFLNEIEPELPKSEPFFITDFPSRISPLCRPRDDEPYLAERFEAYLGGMELGNGNTENTDADAVLKAFREEEKKRKSRGESCPPIDMEFVEALRIMQKKSYAGIGLGVDRLVMLLGNIPDIGSLI